MINIHNSNYDNDWLGNRRFTIVDVSDAFYESGFDLEEVEKRYKLYKPEVNKPPKEDLEQQDNTNV